MKSLTEIEREARRTRDLIAELKGHTPRFNQAKERAEEELKVHLAKIDAERAHLDDLKDAAALIVQHLGADVPSMTEAEVAEVMAQDADAVLAMGEDEPEPVVAVADSPQDFEAQPETEADHDAATFETIGAIAAEITAGVAAIAGDPPPAPDASEADEMTDEQVERKELELAGAEARPAKFFNAFAANPFA